MKKNGPFIICKWETKVGKKWVRDEREKRMFVGLLACLLLWVTRQRNNSNNNSVSRGHEEGFQDSSSSFSGSHGDDGGKIRCSAIGHARRRVRGDKAGKTSGWSVMWLGGEGGELQRRRDHGMNLGCSCFAWHALCTVPLRRYTGRWMFGKWQQWKWVTPSIRHRVHKTIKGERSLFNA